MVDRENDSHSDRSNAASDSETGDGPAGDAKGWMKYAGMGIELAGYTLGLTAVGYAIDHFRGHETPFGTAFGTMVGFAFGMFRFIQRASQAPKH